MKFHKYIFLILSLIITIGIIYISINDTKPKSKEEVLKLWHSLDGKIDGYNTRIDLYDDIKVLIKDSTALEITEMLGYEDDTKKYKDFQTYKDYMNEESIEGTYHVSNKYIYYLGPYCDLAESYEYFLIVYYKNKNDSILGTQLIRLVYDN